ncbi:MAG: MoxR family ATPase, partial [Clostridiales bacterium]|nr:MoxR family ATPase [Clostridiales bacterium]
PEAQMDRFLMRISLGYPTVSEEATMITRFNAVSPLSTLKPVAEISDVLALQRAVEQVYVDEKIHEYVVALMTHTRNNEFVALGASPRASIVLCKAAQAWALYNQRNYVIPDDVIKMAPHVLTHRIMLKQESRLKKISQASIIEMALNETKVPSA